jgi:phosphate transport system substrate-binding protein
MFPSVKCHLHARERIDGSMRGPTRAIAIAMLLGFCGAALADGFSIGGTGAALGTMELLAKEFHSKNPDIAITTEPSLGSGGGIRAVLAGVIGLAVTSRPISESERKLGAVEIEYARTPFVFAVSAKSVVSAITGHELAEIYSGKMANWADGSPVRIVLRPTNDIDTEMIQKISPDVQRGVVSAQSRRGVRLSVNDQDAADDIEAIPGAVGPTTLALIVSEKRALRALKFNGQKPTAENAASGTYPHFKRLFLVTGAKRLVAVERFMAFVRSPAGRNIIVSNGQWIP